MKTLRVVDFETTGIPPDAALCEVGWTDVRLNGSGGIPEIGDTVAYLTDPGRPMPPEARAVHHLSDFDVGGAISPDRALIKLSQGADVFVAHNAAFEREFFTGGERDWICTLKCAKRAWPELKSYGNQFLRYHLGFELDDRAMPPHRAGPDTFVTAHILTALLPLADVEQLIRWTEMPTHYPTIPMTKHKGKKWSDPSVDVGLLRWFINQDHVDADIKAAAREELQRRDSGRGGARF